MSATVAQVMKVATSQIGYNRPIGSATKFGAWYGIPTGQWCAMFVSWVANEVGALDIIPKHAWTPSGAQWFRDRGQWTNGIKGIKRGDIVYFDFPGPPDRISHVGIVERVNANGSVVTIEGNTSGTVGGNQRNGGLVARKTRKAYIVGYGRPKYKKASTPAKAPAKTTAKAPKKLVVEDSYFGPETIGGLQTSFGTPKDNKISSPSLLVIALQKFLNAKGFKGYNGKKLVVDGYGLVTGRKTHTVWAFQSFLISIGLLNKVYRDGIINRGTKSPTVLAIQKAINQRKLK